MKGRGSASDDPIGIRCEFPHKQLTRATWAYYLEAQIPGSNTAMIQQGEVCDVHLHDLPVKGEPFGKHGHKIIKRELRRLR